MITEKLSNSRKLSNEVAGAKFGQAPRIKMNKIEYADTTRSMHLSGKINVSEVLLRAHKENPYMSVDELIGELQIILMESWNEFKSLNNTPMMGKLSLNDLMGNLPEQVRQ